MREDAPAWHFDARAVLATFEATRLPDWLGGHVVARNRARGRARRAVAATYGTVLGDEERNERGLVGAYETDPRRRKTTEPFMEDTEMGVRCGYDFSFVAAVDGERGLATWPEPDASRETVREALAAEIRSALGREAAALDWPGVGEPVVSLEIGRGDPAPG